MVSKTLNSCFQTESKGEKKHVAKDDISSSPVETEADNSHVLAASSAAPVNSPQHRQQTEHNSKEI